MIAADPMLLKAILEDSFDDTRRLIYTDWLEENGQAERAEFIRVQCAIAELDDIRRKRDAGSAALEPWAYWPGEIERAGAALRRREQDLWVMRVMTRPEHPCQWFEMPGWACHADIGQTKIVWTTGVYEEIIAIIRRGFVDELECTLADWFGEQCPHCVSAPMDWTTGAYECSRCDDTGWLPGWGPDIVIGHPITKLRLADMQAGSQVPEAFLPWLQGLPCTDENMHHAALAWARQEANLPPLRILPPEPAAD